MSDTKDHAPGLVSVIIPTHNRGRYLTDALASIVGQRYRPIEIIVVDDGSTEDDLGVARSWWDALAEDCKSGCRLKLVRQENAGPSRARNRGVEESSGEFIQFLDSDDMLHPDKLATQIAELQRDPHLGYVFSSLVPVHIDAGRVVREEGPRRVTPQSFDVGRHIALGNSLQTSVGVYRRATCLAIGPWDETLRVGTDIEYNLRLILSRTPAKYVPGGFVYLRRHEGPRTSRGAGTANLIHTFETLERQVHEGGTVRERASAAPWFVYAYSRLGFEALVVGELDRARLSLRRAWGYAASWKDRLKVAVLWAAVAMPVPAEFRSRLGRLVLRLAPYRRVLSKLRARFAPT